MSNLIIVAGSVTTASRISKKLNSYKDVFASVIHTPSQINNSGCSYSIRTQNKNLPLIKQLEKNNKIKYKKLYIENLQGKEYSYHDIS